MKRLWILAAALATLASAQPLHAETQTWFGFQVGISGGSAPPPPVFHSEPRVVYVNDVHVVRDDRCNDDMFRANGMWWRMSRGYWYRASSYRGPWRIVDVRRVPERVLVVPAGHWKNHPRYKKSRPVYVVDDGHRGHGRGHGKGHDKGRGRGHDHH
jgi:hypothetical protein